MQYDVIIVGAGIVGLATCLQIQKNRPGLKVLLLEKEKQVGLHQTSHNSGVIHSGIYYRPGSFKAKCNRRGYGLLRSFCDQHEIFYEICGKIIVATRQKELSFLQTLYERGVKNGLAGLKKLGSAEIRDYEPAVAGLAGILVPETGIIEFGAVAEKFLEVIRKNGMEVVLGTPVKAVSRHSGIVVVATDTAAWQAKQLVTCGGLQSDRLALLTDRNLPVRIIPFRGEYYTLKPLSRKLVRNLVYPVPDPSFPFLGVHFTRMINGEVEAGPNAVLAFKREGYRKTDFDLKDTVDILKWPGFRKIAGKYWRQGAGEFYRSLYKKGFVKALRRLIPEIDESDLLPGGAGVRAQACGEDGRLLDDFYFLEEDRILHVCNAPSPAATASLAIGEYVAARVLAGLS